MRISLISVAFIWLAGCAALPELGREPSVPVDAEFPALVDLRPLLSSAEDLAPDQTAQAGQSLEFRAADLRRRAARLRALQLE